MDADKTTSLGLLRAFYLPVTKASEAAAAAAIKASSGVVVHYTRRRRHAGRRQHVHLDTHGCHVCGGAAVTTGILVSAVVTLVEAIDAGGGQLWSRSIFLCLLYLCGVAWGHAQTAWSLVPRVLVNRGWRRCKDQNETVYHAPTAVCDYCPHRGQHDNPCHTKHAKCSRTRTGTPLSFLVRLAHHPTRSPGFA